MMMPSEVFEISPTFIRRDNDLKLEDYPGALVWFLERTSVVIVTDMTLIVISGNNVFNLVYLCLSKYFCGLIRLLNVLVNL